ncbi:VCBS repeat-containing protein, partial [Candidatus Peribacteria bacterium]|nr:VCBS repeat-containing protein [Candidatus Peribacteria bacterium]
MKNSRENSGTYTTDVSMKHDLAEKEVRSLDPEEAALVDEAFDSDIAETAAFGSEEIPKQEKGERKIMKLIRRIRNKSKSRTSREREHSNPSLNGQIETAEQRLVLSPIIGFSDDISTGDYPSDIAIDDINNDGMGDYAVACMNSDEVIVALGNGNGGFDNVQTFTGKDSCSVDFGDIDGDGNQDIVFNNFAGGEIVYAMGNGDGTFGEEHVIGGMTHPARLRLEDLNNDELFDAVVTSQTRSELLILLSNGDGFTQVQTITGVYRPGIPGLGDLDGDGDVDMFVGGQHNTGHLFEGHGDGTFTEVSTHNIGKGGASATIGDYNGDGKGDTSSMNHDSGQINVFHGNGDMTLEDAGTYNASMPYGSESADFTGDGKDDIVFSQLTGGIGVLSQDESGSYGVQTFSGGTSGSGLAIGDIDGNKTLDVLTAGYNEDKVHKFDGTVENTAPAEEVVEEVVEEEPVVDITDTSLIPTETPSDPVQEPAAEMIQQFAIDTMQEGTVIETGSGYG